ncbi:unnamed protein product [Acanthosepion pharaonis]|uniref:Uncharacterized protein n=1 Tax=Acanthosepion pharaonis TaxID=158019 RepID=A0A812AT85_ACAPH|nr:unnamed protein product [Sepia pharaonis]
MATVYFLQNVSLVLTSSSFSPPSTAVIAIVLLLPVDVSSTSTLSLIDCLSFPTSFSFPLTRSLFPVLSLLTISSLLPFPSLFCPLFSHYFFSPAFPHSFLHSLIYNNFSSLSFLHFSTPTPLSFPLPLVISYFHPLSFSRYPLPLIASLSATPSLSLWPSLFSSFLFPFLSLFSPTILSPFLSISFVYAFLPLLLFLPLTFLLFHNFSLTFFMVGFKQTSLNVRSTLVILSYIFLR